MRTRTRTHTHGNTCRNTPGHTDAHVYTGKHGDRLTQTGTPGRRSQSRTLTSIGTKPKKVRSRSEGGSNKQYPYMVRLAEGRRDEQSGKGTADTVSQDTELEKSKGFLTADSQEIAMVWRIVGHHDKYMHGNRE